MYHVRIGDRVRIVECSGTLSGRTGVVLPLSSVKTNGRGIPEIPGCYKPLDRQREVVLLMDDGSVETMFKNRLQAV